MQMNSGRLPKPESRLKFYCQLSSSYDCTLRQLTKPLTNYVVLHSCTIKKNLTQKQQYSVYLLPKMLQGLMV